MRLLALSDIHGNVAAVERLRNAETNRFDAVVIAGDLGSERAPEIVAILSTFACPVLYVFGNHDAELDYETSLGPGSHHLHLQPAQLNGWSVIGFSGLPMAWGRNPWANEPDALERNIEALRKSSNGIDPSRTIVVTHDRVSRATALFPGVPLFLFGHRHGFSSVHNRASHFVNVSAVDHFNAEAAENGGVAWPRKSLVGNAAVIEIAPGSPISANQIALPRGRLSDYGRSF